MRGEPDVSDNASSHDIRRREFEHLSPDLGVSCSIFTSNLIFNPLLSKPRELLVGGVDKTPIHDEKSPVSLVPLLQSFSPNIRLTLSIER